MEVANHNYFLHTKMTHFFRFMSIIMFACEGDTVPKFVCDSLLV